MHLKYFVTHQSSRSGTNLEKELFKNLENERENLDYNDLKEQVEFFEVEKNSENRLYMLKNLRKWCSQAAFWYVF